MTRLLVLLALVALLPVLFVVGYGMLSPRQSPDLPGSTDEPSPLLRFWSKAREKLANWLMNIPVLENASQRVRARATWSAQYVLVGIARAVSTLPVVLALAVVGLMRGVAARDHLIDRFGFSSPTRFLIAKGGLGIVFAMTWLLCFAPFSGQPFTVICFGAALSTLALSYMLAKHFPVVW